MKPENLFSKDILYFIQCANFKSFSKAGKALYISQSTLSVAMKRLEEDLGYSLFERGRGQGEVRLTKEAESLLFYLNSQNEIIKTSLTTEVDIFAPIRIASIAYFSRKYLMPVLSKNEILRRAKVFHVRSGKAMEAIREGSIDLAFIVGSSKPIQDEDFCFEIKNERVGIVGLRSRFSHIEKVKSMSELKNEPWIIGDKVHDDWPNCLNHLESAYYVEDHFSARFLVLDGYGIGAIQLDYFTEKELKKLAISKVPFTSNNLKLFAVLNKKSKIEIRDQCLKLIRKIKSTI